MCDNLAAAQQSLPSCQPAAHPPPPPSPLASFLLPVSCFRVVLAAASPQITNNTSCFLSCPKDGTLQLLRRNHALQSYDSLIILPIGIVLSVSFRPFNIRFERHLSNFSHSGLTRHAHCCFPVEMFIFICRFTSQWTRLHQDSSIG